MLHLPSRQAPASVPAALTADGAHVRRAGPARCRATHGAAPRTGASAVEYNYRYGFEITKWFDNLCIILRTFI